MNLIIGIVFFVIGNIPEAPIEINNVRYGGDNAVKHFLFQSRGNTNLINGILQAKAEIKNILQFLTEIVVSHSVGIPAIAVQQCKKVTDSIQRCDLLQKRQGDEVGNLVSVIQLPHRVINDSLFDIIADHGAG